MLKVEDMLNKASKRLKLFKLTEEKIKNPKTTKSILIEPWMLTEASQSVLLEVCASSFLQSTLSMDMHFTSEDLLDGLILKLVLENLWALELS